MGFASINSTNPRTNLWNFREKILRIADFEKRIFFESAILNFLSRPFWFFFQKKLYHLKENKQPVHMRYHLFLHYGWFHQNLEEDQALFELICTRLYLTRELIFNDFIWHIWMTLVRFISPDYYFSYLQEWCHYIFFIGLTLVSNAKINMLIWTEGEKMTAASDDICYKKVVFFSKDHALDQTYFHLD